MICADLQENIQMLKKLTQTQFTAEEVQRLVVSNCGNDNYDEYDREFPFRFLETISAINLNIADRSSPSFGSSRTKWIEYIPFDREDAEVVRKEISQLLLSHSFSIRHYTSAAGGGRETSDRVVSDFAQRKLHQAVLAPANDKKGQHQQKGLSEDWILRGDSAFTDWLFCIDRICPPSNLKIENIVQYYDEIDIDFLVINKRHLSDVLVLGSSDFGKKLPEIKLGIKVQALAGKLIYLPEMLFSHLYENKRISAAWLNMLDSERHTQTLLDSIDKLFPSFRVYIPGSVKVEHWKKIPIILPDAKVKKANNKTLN